MDDPALDHQVDRFGHGTDLNRCSDRGSIPAPDSRSTAVLPVRLREMELVDLTAWAPREGGSLSYRVETRFGLDSLPAGASGRQVSAVGTALDANFVPSQGGWPNDAIVVFDPQ